MNENYVVGIDIGSSNVRVVTGEIVESERIKLIGVADCPAEGMHKGEVADPQKVNGALRRALDSAEKMAGVRIRGACISITGAGIRSFDSEGVLTRQEKSGITPEEANYVTENARKVPLPADRTVIHMMEQSFMIDGAEGVENPVGKEGSRLERTVHIVTAVRRQVEMLKDLLDWNGIELVKMVFAPFADAKLISAGSGKKENGLLINIGGEVTSFACYRDGAIKSSGVLPVGGFNVSNDLAIGMSFPIEVTDRLKKERCLFRGVHPDGEAGEPVVEIEIGGRDYRFNTQEIAGIVTPRCVELFSLISNHAGLDSDFRGPVYLAGGGSRMDKIEQVAEDVFGAPAIKLQPSGVEGLVELAGDAGWVTGAGLLFHGRDLITGYRESRGSGCFNRIISGLKKVVC
ncbi:MAG: cell division protein FtsA [Candidatus Krumholzibacteriales bacterium]